MRCVQRGQRIQRRHWTIADKESETIMKQDRIIKNEYSSTVDGVTFETTVEITISMVAGVVTNIATQVTTINNMTDNVQSHYQSYPPAKWLELGKEV